MSDHVIGIAAKITSKEAGKNNNLIYSVCVEEDGQEDTWFGYGWDEPQFTEGAEIEFDIQYNGDYLNIDVDSLNVLQDGKPKRSSGGRGGRSSGGGRGGNSSRGQGNSRGGNSSSRSSSSRGKPAAKRGAAKGGSDDKMSKEEWAQKDQIIRRQACMNTSINLIRLFNEAGVIPAPKKKSDGQDALVALCNEEADRLYDQYEEQVYGGGSSKRGNTRGREQYSDDIPD